MNAGGATSVVRDYRVVPVQPGMADGIARLQRLHWASGFRVNLAYLRWKYFENPYVVEPLIYVALHGDEVVGMRGIFGASWNIGEGLEAAIPCAADTLIHPAHRDQGLFERLSDLAFADLAAKGYPHVLNLSPTAANYVASVVSMGWRSIGSTAELARASDAGTARRKLVARVPRNDTVRGMARLGRRIRSSAGSMTFGRLDAVDATTRGEVQVSCRPRPEAMATAAAAEPASEAITQVRDARFFSWRFDNPRAAYRFLYIGEPDLSGFMVLHNSMGRSRVNIVDWSFRSHADASALLAVATEGGRFGDLRIWTRSLDPQLVGLLRDAGFTTPAASSEPTRLAGKAMVRPTSDHSNPAGWVVKGRSLDSAASWDLQMVAADSF